MAVVKEYIHSSGAHVYIMDDCYAHLTPEENEKRYEQAWRNVFQALAKREIERQKESKNNESR